MRYLLPFCTAVLILTGTLYAAQENQTGESETNEPGTLFDADFNKEPTYIKADTLTLKTALRTFVYSGNVEAIQGDMTLTSDILEGTYDQENQIDTLTAKDNVIILKGPNIRATGQKAIYERNTETMTLTDSPELQQKGSVLTADSITIYLKEDRSTAQGTVRVKVAEEKEEKK